MRRAIASVYLSGLAVGGAAQRKMNHLLVAGHDGVDRRILPRPQTCEAKLACVIGSVAGMSMVKNTGRDLTEHVPSLPEWRRTTVNLTRQADIAALIGRKPRIFCSAVIPRVASDSFRKDNLMSASTGTISFSSVYTTPAFWERLWRTAGIILPLLPSRVHRLRPSAADSAHRRTHWQPSTTAIACGF